jgi:hypothetical protein
VRWGGGRATYVIDVAAKTIYGDTREASAEEPYRYVYAGADVSHEAAVSPPEVGVVAFEEEAGTVRAFMCNMLDMPRDASLELRGRTFHVTLAPGELRQVG